MYVCMFVVVLNNTHAKLCWLLACFAGQSLGQSGSGDTESLSVCQDVHCKFSVRSAVLKLMLHVIVVNFVNKPMAKYPNLA